MAQGRRLRERVAGQTAMSDVVHSPSVNRERGTLARIAGVSPLDSTSRRAYRIALGELVVGDILDGLGQRWDVLHDLPLGGESTLEHLVMGPSGIFAVRTANHGDVEVVIDGDIVLAGGEPHDDIEVCVRQAVAAAQALTTAAGETVLVQPLLVVVSPRRLTVRREPSGVLISESSGLERMLTRAPSQLGGEQVARISDLADLETTWPEASEVTLDTQRLNRQFTLVRAEVRSALAIRTAWVVGALLVACSGLWMMIARFVTQMVAV